jgi:hypothetical protein
MGESRWPKRMYNWVPVERRKTGRSKKDEGMM